MRNAKGKAFYYCVAICYKSTDAQAKIGIEVRPRQPENAGRAPALIPDHYFSGSQ
jgi:hypothetical protein